jgi:hypothetical protein
MRAYLLWAVLLACSGAALAQSPAAPSERQTLMQHAERRFPQPVMVGALIGRDVLEPIEAQPILGHVKSVVRVKDGGLDMIVTIGGILGFGARPVAVPVEAMALLGEYVACMDFSPEQLQAFQTDDGSGDTPLAANDTIKVGLAKPFH